MNAELEKFEIQRHNITMTWNPPTESGIDVGFSNTVTLCAFRMRFPKAPTEIKEIGEHTLRYHIPSDLVTYEFDNNQGFEFWFYGFVDDVRRCLAVRNNQEQRIDVLMTLDEVRQLTEWIAAILLTK